MGEELVDESPVMGGGGLRSLRMKRPLMVKHIEGGGGSSLVRLGERGAPARSNSPAVRSSATLELGRRYCWLQCLMKEAYGVCGLPCYENDKGKRQSMKWHAPTQYLEDSDSLVCSPNCLSLIPS